MWEGGRWVTQQAATAKNIVDKKAIAKNIVDITEIKTATQIGNGNRKRYCRCRQNGNREKYRQ